MKSERRHELKTNELAKGLQRLPELWKQYGGKVLMVAIAILLVVVLIRYRNSTQRAALDVARQNLAGAYSLLAELREPDPFSMQDMHQFAIRRKLAVQNAQLAIDAVLAGTSDPSLLSSALVARGDLNWLVATLPTLPVATTQPALQFDTPSDEALNQSRESYQEVLQSYPQQTMQVNSARFGLAAIAEQRADWGLATEMYEAIQKDERAPISLKTLAGARLMLLGQIKQPIFLASAASVPDTNTASTRPVELPGDTSAPLVEAPATGPASVAPATRPSTQPSEPLTAP